MTTIEKYISNLHEFTNSIDFKSNTIEEVLKFVPILRNILGLEHLNAYVMNVPTDNFTLTRARKNETKGTLFENISQINYPDKSIVTKHGRANIWNQSRFYCSDIPGTSLFEVRPNDEWITTMDIKITKPNLKLLTVNMDSKYNSIGNHIFTEADVAFNQFMSEKFMEKIPSDKDYLYLPTAIITNLLIQNVDGIVYPSVASKLKGENFALRTEIIDNYAQIVDIRVHESYDHSENGDFKVKCLYRADNAKPNGQIDWKTVTCDGHNINESIYINKHI